MEPPLSYVSHATILEFDSRLYTNLDEDTKHLTWEDSDVPMINLLKADRCNTINLDLSIDSCSTKLISQLS